MAEKIVIDLDINTSKGKQQIEELNKSINKTNKEVTDVNKSSKQLTGTLDKASGGAISSFKGMLDGVKGLNAGFKGLRGAIIATGLGALLLIVTSLIEYFKNFEGGVKLVQQIMNTLAGTINAIVENASKLLTLDFAGFFGAVADGTKDAWENTNKLFEAQEKLFELNKKFIVENANLNAEIESQARIVRDTTKSFEERLAAQKELDRLSEKLIQNEKELNDAELVRLKTELALENNYEKRRGLEIEIEQTMANLITVESKMAAQRDKASKAQRQIEEEQLAEQKKKSDERVERAKKEQARLKAIKDKELEDEFNNLQKINAIREKFRLQSEDAEDVTDFQKLNRKYQRDLLELERLNATEQQKLDLETYYNSLRQTQYIQSEDYLEQLEIEAEDERLKRLGDDALKEISISKSIAIAKEQIRQAEINNIERGFQLLGQVAGKNKVLQAAALIGESAIGIAKIVINTQAANAAARLKYALIPGGLALAAAEISANKVGAGIGIAANIAATAKGLSSLKASGSVPTAGGNSLSGGTGGGVSQPASFNVVGASSTNQLADAIGSQSQEPVKAYVVSNDVTTAQSMDRNIVSGASI